MDVKKNWIIGSDDQWVICIGLVVFLTVGGCYFWHKSVVNHGLIDFDQVERRQAKFLVDINSAPWTEFANLPGIGEKLAREIVAYRTTAGGFSAAEDLQNVRGIGERKLAAIRPFLIVNAHPPVAGMMEQEASPSHQPLE